MASTSATIEPHLPHGIAFSEIERRALLAAVAAHDTVDLDAGCPGAIRLEYDISLLSRSYWLSRSLWDDLEPEFARNLATRLMYGRALNAAETRAFKDVRARAKQLRFAYATLSARRSYPPRLDRLTRLMGKIQDAIKLGHWRRAAVRAALLRVKTSKRGMMALAREAACFVPGTPEDFRTHILAEIGRIELALAKPALSNQAFHETRKIVSRLVAFYDTMTVLASSDAHRAIDLYLSTINGLMGKMHDEMMERKAKNPRAYRAKAESLPPLIASRLACLAAAFRTGAA